LLTQDINFLSSYLMNITVSKCALLIFSTFFSMKIIWMILFSIIFSFTLLLFTFFLSITSKPSTNLLFLCINLLLVLSKPCSLSFVNIFKCFTYSSAMGTAISAFLFVESSFFQDGTSKIQLLG